MEEQIYELLKPKMEKPIYNLLGQILNAYQMPIDKKLKHYSSASNIFCEEMRLIINSLDGSITKGLPILEVYDPKEQLIYMLMDGIASVMIETTKDNKW